MCTVAEGRNVWVTIRLLVRFMQVGRTEAIGWTRTKGATYNITVRSASLEHKAESTLVKYGSLEEPFPCTPRWKAWLLQARARTRECLSDRHVLVCKLASLGQIDGDKNGRPNQTASPASSLPMKRYKV